MQSCGTNAIAKQRAPHLTAESEQTRVRSQSLVSVGRVGDSESSLLPRQEADPPQKKRGRVETVYRNQRLRLSIPSIDNAAPTHLPVGRSQARSATGPQPPPGPPCVSRPRPAYSESDQSWAAGDEAMP